MNGRLTLCQALCYMCRIDFLFNPPRNSTEAHTVNILILRMRKLKFTEIKELTPKRTEFIFWLIQFRGAMFS